MQAKKLQLKPGQSISILNAPKGFDVEGAQVSHKLAAKCDAVLLFCQWHDELAKQWNKVISALGETGVFWVAYPKKSSRLESDLAGMMTWPIYKDSPWQPVAIIAIDENWSAARFKYAPNLSEEREARANEKILDSDGTLCVDKKARAIHPSKDLAKLLNKNAAARAFFDTLSFTNKKEYVLWIIESKRPETRADRLAKTIEKLTAGKRNPSEK